ncbi:hypothetical protein PG985_014010 [Apiospora marii]|uniref:uncharacterized protein n=1 Tax=Apiospora marii TaxID=335849 RepID=UPI00312E9DCE
MTGQLPHGAEGPAALSLIFAFASLACSATLIWLASSHNARFPYIACLAICTLISTVFSIIQQIHVVGWYRDVTIQQFEAKQANPTSPDNAIANGSTGMDLVFFYIQFYCYNVESMFVLFWAAELGQSVYGLTQKYHWVNKLRYFNYVAKAISVLLPLLFVSLLRAPAVQNNTSAFIALANLPLWLCIGLGGIIMLAILGRYIYTQRVLLRFDPGRSASADPYSTPRSGRTRIFSRLWCKYIYDRWLMTRFFIAFVRLAIFQVTVTVFQQFATSGTKGISNKLAAAWTPADAPDLSVEHARRAMYLFIPGNTPGVALMLIFGTTVTFRHHMYKAFVPKRFQKGCGSSQLPWHAGDAMNNQPEYPLETDTAYFAAIKKPVPRNNMATPEPSCPKKALLKQVSFRSDSAMSSIDSPTSIHSPTTIHSPMSILSPTPLMRSSSTKPCMRRTAPTPPLRAKSVSFRSDTAPPSSPMHSPLHSPMESPMESPMHSPTNCLQRSQSASLPRRAHPPPVTRFRSNTAMSSHNHGRLTPTPKPDLMKTLPERPSPAAYPMSNPIEGLAMGPGVETEWHEDSAAFIIRRIEQRHGVQIDSGSSGGLI